MTWAILLWLKIWYIIIYNYFLDLYIIDPSPYIVFSGKKQKHIFLLLITWKVLWGWWRDFGFIFLFFFTGNRSFIKMSWVNYIIIGPRPKTKTQIHSCLREEASWTRHRPLRTVFDSEDHHRQCPPFKSHASESWPKTLPVSPLSP